MPLRSTRFTTPPTSVPTGLRIDLERILEPELVLGHLELLGVVGENLPAAEGLVVAALAIDDHARIPFLVVLLARSRGKPPLERLEDHFLVDALLVGDGIDHHQNLFVHCCPTSSTPIVRLHCCALPGAQAAPCRSPRSPPSPARDRPRARCRHRRP